MHTPLKRRSFLKAAGGRVLEPIDRGEVDRIVAEIEKEGSSIRDLFKLVVQSDICLAK